ncbi:Hypothetical predicted protein [Marmota monax]|uniref:Leucine-rich repeat-containing protein 41 n=1 Tax=Marmota monax TaxID=9995 RepID=A0A5E4CXU2_MARMO|nr:hypothetical protein GHT09_012125 [Marmota monax]VTJ86664.1 Hypothetical predicted protein [Marmota monax]
MDVPSVGSLSSVGGGKQVEKRTWKEGSPHTYTCNQGSSELPSWEQRTCLYTHLGKAVLNSRQLRHLELRGIKLTDFSLEPLQILLDSTATTLNSLDLAACGITDSQLQTLLPALSRCSQLVIFSIHGNRLYTSTLSDLLLHTARLSQLSIELYPAPLESYDARGTIHPGRCSQLCAELTAIVRDFRQPNFLVFCTVPCRRCGFKLMYNQGLIHCSCPTAA